MRRSVTLLAALLLVVASTPISASAADRGAPVGRADEVVVRYAKDATAAERQRVVDRLDLRVVDAAADERTQVVVGEGRSRATIRRLLAADPNVVAVADNSWRELADDVGHETAFRELWGLHNTGQRVNGTTGKADIDIDGLEALRAGTGSPDVIVAVIDDGIDIEHWEVSDSYWQNEGEDLGNDGVDNDGNGYIDDRLGWNFCEDRPFNQPVDPDGPGRLGMDGHGTHIAGTIAARQTGYGIVGVAPGVRVMNLKAFTGGRACGNGDAALAEAIDYAAAFGVPIINASWGGPSPSSVLDAAIADSGALFVTAAGNSGRDIEVAGSRYYPAASTVPNVLTVTAIGPTGALPSFANYGRTSVDIAAPGVNILSTWPRLDGVCDPCYAWSSGTSMAVPHVAGIAALALSTTVEPLTTAQLKARVLGAGTALSSVASKTVTGRLANAWRVVDHTGPTLAAIGRHGINVGSIVGTTVSTTLTWPAAVDDQSAVASYVVRRRSGSGSWTILTSALTARSYRTSLPFGTALEFGVAGRDAPGNVGPQAVAAPLTAVLLQDGTSLATYAGAWSTSTSSAASNGKLRTSTRAGASVELRTSARAIAVVGRKGPGRGQAKIYVDGAYVQTIDLNRSSLQSRVVVFSKSWSTTGVHTVKVVVVGTAGRPRVDIDAFAILR